MVPVNPVHSRPEGLSLCRSSSVPPPRPIQLPRLPPAAHARLFNNSVARQKDKGKGKRPHGGTAPPTDWVQPRETPLFYMCRVGPWGRGAEARGAVRCRSRSRSRRVVHGDATPWINRLMMHEDFDRHADTRTDHGLVTRGTLGVPRERRLRPLTAVKNTFRRGARSYASLGGLPWWRDEAAGARLALAIASRIPERRPDPWLPRKPRGPSAMAASKSNDTRGAS